VLDALRKRLESGEVAIADSLVPLCDRVRLSLLYLASAAPDCWSRQPLRSRRDCYPAPLH
jgi:hypothetical protein